MSNKTLNLSEALYNYLRSVSDREAPLLRDLRAETATLDTANMQIAPEQGQFMAMLVKLMGAHRVLEVGTYTGYSALAMALVLPDKGHMVCCDTSREWTDIARRYWHQAGVDHKMELHLRPALETLDELLAQEDRENFDFAFIDADKENYEAYFERCLALMRPGA